MVQDAMSESGVPFSALDRIAVTTGPGTFTGQRVGLAFARALGFALKKPVMGVTTLDAMAEEALTGQEENALWAIVAADAKRGEAYVAARSRAGEILVAPELILLGTLADRFACFRETFGDAPVLAGTASDAAMEQLSAQGFRPRDSRVRQPHAIQVARLGADAPIQSSPKPLYLREPDAKLPKEAR